MKCLKLITFALAALALAGCATDSASRQERSQVEASMLRFQTAFNNHSFEDLRPALAPDFRIYGLPPGMSVDGLRAGMQAAGPRMEVQILSLHRVPDGFAARIGLYEMGKATELKIGFAPDGRIRSIDNGLWSRSASVSVPVSMTSRFIVSHGLMFVRASVNGKDGYFLVDSGSSGMLLSPRYFRASEHGALPGISSGVHGTGPALGGIRVENFHWGQFKVEDGDAVLRDLSGLEGPENTPLLGAIGHEQLKDCSMAIDWPAREIRIYATNADGSRKLPEESRPTGRISFNYLYHVPLLHVSIGGKDYPMMLDSGASTSLLPGSDIPGGHFHLAGAGFRLSDGSAQQRVGALCGIVDEARIGPVVLKNLPVLIYKVPYMGDNGLLGIDLFKQCRTEVNFHSREILFR